MVVFPFYLANQIFLSISGLFSYFRVINVVSPVLIQYLEYVNWRSMISQMTGMSTQVEMFNSEISRCLNIFYHFNWSIEAVFTSASLFTIFIAI